MLAAGKRCLRHSAEAGGVALYIDAKNNRAAAWYEAFRAERLVGVAGALPITMAMSLKTIATALKASGKL